jgi:nanoRNase/pAp phosphatase (c-di-AMP/oligoRNAs hydrolase)
VDIGILFRDLGSETRVSLRTSESIDAAHIASLFGGGGHSRRAGWTEPQPAEVAVPRIVERCQAEMG